MKRSDPGTEARATDTQNAAEPPSETSYAANLPRRKCAYLHPRHLTGCRERAEPGSRFCVKHGGRPDGDEQ